MKSLIYVLISTLVIIGGIFGAIEPIYAQDPPSYPLPTCTNEGDCKEDAYWTQYGAFYTAIPWPGCQPCSVRVAFAIRENCPERGCEVKIGAIELIDDCPKRCTDYLQYAVFDDIIKKLAEENPNLCPYPKNPGDCYDEFYVISSTCYVYTTNHPQFQGKKTALPCTPNCCRRKYRICLDQDGVRHATLIERQRDLPPDPSLCLNPYESTPPNCVDVCGTLE
ncbi:hypothetical protein MASR2M18_12880 [Ignavibacteria bacterium]|nr:hypothetical protein [Bacteroidota bacterium]MCZ2131592.1 hypothetical protein [Bacteroidota bacterium]